MVTRLRSVPFEILDRILGYGLQEAKGLIIQEVDPPNGLTRCWVLGCIERHTFCALLNPRHSLKPGIELGESLISELCLRQMADHRLVAAYDRGWDLEPTTQSARQIVDYLTAHLAEHVYARLREIRSGFEDLRPKRP
jgi:hypothetical protein